MITHKRAEYLKRALGSLFRLRTKSETYPIIASQDFNGWRVTWDVYGNCCCHPFSKEMLLPLLRQTCFVTSYPAGLGHWAAGHRLQDGEDAEVKAVLQKYEATGALKFLRFTPKTLLWRTADVQGASACIATRPHRN